MSGFVLAIDNGSQSTKVSVIDADGVVHSSAQQRLQPYAHPAPGRCVHPGDDIWESIAAACRAALDGFAGDRSQIVGVGLCTIRFCRALLDADGTLVEPLLSWMDERVSRPHDGTDAVYVTTSSGYVTHRLTGQFRDTAANYQGMWPIDQVTARWSDDASAYESTGLTRSMLFDLVDPGALLGEITEAASTTTGIPVGTPVFATANDKAVEALGAGVDQSTVLLSLGTYIASMTVGTSPASDDASYWVNFGSIPGAYLYESNGIRRGMWTVSWIRDLMLPSGALPAGQSAEELLNAEAASVPPGSSGVMALMDWLAPSDKVFRRGALLGFDGTQGRPHVYRAVLEGIALTMADHIEAMEKALDRQFEQIVVTGGGAKSDVMMQIVADVLDRPARRTALDDAAGLGAAICAAVGSGMHSSFAQASAAMVRPGAVFSPSSVGVAAYRPVRAAYRDLHRFTDPLFQHTTGA